MVYNSWEWPPREQLPWESDALGNKFFTTYTPGVVRLDATGISTYSLSLSQSSSIAADQKGGVYSFGHLDTTVDLGCGALVPTAPSSGYIARLDPSWSCVYSRVLPVPVSVLADEDGGAILSVTSTSALDLGCGALPAAPLAAPSSPTSTRQGAASSAKPCLRPSWRSPSTRTRTWC